MPKRNSSPLIPIFITVFLDMLGVGIIIPVIPALFFDANSEFFPVGTDREFRSVVYGFLIASFPFMQFFGAPMLGSLSDRFGRKPLLTVSLAGTMVGYLLFAYAIGTGNLALLFISRMLPGFMGGNISIVYSAIADVSDEKSKPKNFGLVGMSFGLGFILGPTLGGILADKSVVSWFNAATPFWFTAILTFLNILLLQYNFRETLPSAGVVEGKGGRAGFTQNLSRLKRKRARDIKWRSLFKGFRNVAASFREPGLRVIFSVVLLISLGFSFFTQFFSVLLIEQFDYSEKDIGFLFGWIGLWLVFTQGVIVRRLSRYFAPKKILAFSMLALGLAIGALLLPDRSFWFYLINPCVAVSQGITSPNLTTVVSVQAGPDRQGEVLGINQSMLSIGQIIPPLIAGYLNTLSSSLPILAGSLTILAGWVVYVAVFRRGMAN